MQFSQPGAAIDAGIAVAYQDAFAIPMGFAARNVDVELQGNHRRNLELGSNCMQVLPRLLDRDGLARQQQVDGALNRNDGQRFPCASIEEQDPVL